MAMLEPARLLADDATIAPSREKPRAFEPAWTFLPIRHNAEGEQVSVKDTARNRNVRFRPMDKPATERFQSRGAGVVHTPYDGPSRRKMERLALNRANDEITCVVSAPPVLNSASYTRKMAERAARKARGF